MSWTWLVNWTPLEAWWRTPSGRIFFLVTMLGKWNKYDYVTTLWMVIIRVVSYVRMAEHVKHASREPCRNWFQDALTRWPVESRMVVVVDPREVTKPDACPDRCLFGWMLPGWMTSVKLYWVGLRDGCQLPKHTMPKANHTIEETQKKHESQLSKCDKPYFLGNY